MKKPPTVKLKACVENPPAPPEYQTSGAAAVDLRSAEDVTLWGDGHRLIVSTGYEIEIPPGYEGQVRPRSGLAAKHGVTVLNSPGTIDEDYRGELKVILVNLGEDPFEIEKGDRIAQLVISPVSRADFVIVDELSPTDRGVNGLGSTGS